VHNSGNHPQRGTTLLCPWAAFRIWAAVARQGALARAADDLGMPLTTVHRLVAQIEAALDTRLYTRGVHGITLTDAGTALATCTARMETIASAVEATLRKHSERLRASDQTRIDDHWDALPAVLAVARAGSLAQAAKLLTTHERTVARRINALEAHADVLLFHRPYRPGKHGGGVALTPAGKALLPALEAMEAAVAEASMAISGFDTRPEGVVRIATTDGLASYWVAPRLQELFDRYPKIHIQLLYRAEQPNLLAGEADIWIGYSEPTAGTLVRLSLATIHFQPVASVSYLERHPPPATWQELMANHYLLTHAYYAEHEDDDSDFARWQSLVRQSPQVRITTDLSMTLLAATLAGLGISLQPAGVLDHHPTLRRIDLPFDASAQAYLVYHEGLRHVPRQRATIQAVIDIMTQARLR